MRTAFCRGGPNNIHGDNFCLPSVSCISGVFNAPTFPHAILQDRMGSFSSCTAVGKFPIQAPRPRGLYSFKESFFWGGGGGGGDAYPVRKWDNNLHNATLSRPEASFLGGLSYLLGGGGGWGLFSNGACGRNSEVCRKETAVFSFNSLFFKLTLAMGSCFSPQCCDLICLHSCVRWV